MNKLKKLVITFIVINTIHTSITKAQDIDFGFNIGIGIPFYDEKNLNLELPDSNKIEFFKKGLFNFAIGPYCDINFMDYYIGFGSALNYNIFAFDTRTKNKTETKNYTLYYHFIKTPLLFKIVPLNKLSIYLGPELYFLLKTSKSDNDTIDKPQDFNRNNLGILISMKYEISNINFGFDFSTTFFGIDTYKNNIQKIKNEDKFNRITNNYKKENLIYLSFKVGYNFASLLQQ